DAGAVDGLAVEAPGTEHVGTARRVALRRDATAADDRAIGAPDRTHPPEPGEALERARVDARLDETARQADALGSRPSLLQHGQLVYAERRASEVHVQTPVGLERRRRGHESAGRWPSAPRRQEPGLDLGVRSACRPDVAKGGEDGIARTLRR